MPLTTEQYSAAQAAIQAQHIAGTLTQEEYDAAHLALLKDWVISNNDLASRIVNLVTALDVLVADGAPDAGAGSIGGIAFDITNLSVYGPKTSEGWGDPTPLSGEDGDPGPTGPAGDEAALVEMQNFAGLAHKRLDAAASRRGQVAIPNEAAGPWFTTSGGTAVISLDPPMDRDDYAVRLRVRSASPSSAHAGPVEVVSQAVNAFTVRVPGSARDVVIDWHVTA